MDHSMMDMNEHMNRSISGAMTNSTPDSVTTMNHRGHHPHPTNVSVVVHDHIPTGGSHGAHADAAGQHTMSMFFHGGYSEVVLFSFWQIHSVAGMAGSAVGIFLLGTLYEGLKAFREYLHRTACYCSPKENELMHECPPQCCDHQANTPRQGTPTTSGGVRVVRPPVVWKPPCHWLHWLQTGLHMLQVFTSYALMLVFMTYNAYLCAAVVLGAGAGYFLFGWRRAQTPLTALNEHCN